MINKILLLYLFVISSLCNAKPLIVLDTGHTPEIPGVISSTMVPEFEYNRFFVKSLTQELLKHDWDVHDVRDAHEDRTLVMRTRRSDDATLFLAIHHDSMQQDWLDAGYRNQYRGFSVFVSSKNKFFHESLQCARVLGYGMRNANEVPSLYHSANYPGEHKQLLDSENGVHQYDNLVVLKSSKSPAILLEIGVIVNDAEAIRLRDENVIHNIVKALSTQLEHCKFNK